MAQVAPFVTAYALMPNLNAPSHEPIQPSKRTSLTLGLSACTFGSLKCDGPAVVNCTTCEDGAYKSGFLCRYHHTHRHIKGSNNFRGRIHQWRPLENFMQESMSMMEGPNELVKEIEGDIEEKKKKIEDDTRQLQEKMRMVKVQEEVLHKKMEEKERSFGEVIRRNSVIDQRRWKN